MQLNKIVTQQFFYFSNYSTTMEISKKERMTMNIHLNIFRQREGDTDQWLCLSLSEQRAA